MSLRKKIILIIGFITVFVFCTISYLTWTVIINRSVTLEHENLLENLNRAKQALEIEMRGLETSVSDYSFWDDTYEFVQKPYQEYLDSDFTDSTFTNNRLNILIILDNTGKVIYQRGYNYVNKQEKAIPAELQKHLDSKGLLVTKAESGETFRGLIRLPEGDMIVAAAPILTSQKEGPSRGTMVMGRYLAEPILASIEKTTGLKVSFLDYDNTDNEAGKVLNSLAAGNLRAVRNLDETTMAGYEVLKDIYQKPILLLKVEQDRDIYQHSKNTTGYILFLILTLGILYGLAVIYSIEKLVLKPLAFMNRSLAMIGALGDLSRRMPAVGQFEIANLTKTINNMLSALEESRQELLESEQRFKYLSYHDALTGLHNRTFLEQLIMDISNNYPIYLPLSIINADVDGLKFINDTLGHQEGDNLLKQAARILSTVIEEEEVLARVGGDEFCLILPRTNQEKAKARKNKLMEALNKYNDSQPFFPISISVGVATSETGNINVFELYQKADDAMYNYKLSQSESPKSKVIDLLLAALSERDFIAQGHVQRLVIMAEKMAERLQLSDEHRRNLVLLAKVHDLGKVGIPDEILFKSEKLSREEYAKMQEHSRIGYNIASRSKELSHIAGLILYHHEYWNGRGYPLGLREKEIPLECRILAILDAYDAMTNERPYHSGISSEAARKELIRCSGTQFEPRLVEEFLKLIDEEQGNLVC